MAKLSPLPLKHLGSFTLLFFLSILRPDAVWPDIPFSFAPLTVMALGCILLYKVNASIGFEAFWQKYKTELLLITAYMGICLISLYMNKSRYTDTGELIKWGLTPIIVQGTLAAAIFLFSLPQKATFHPVHIEKNLVKLLAIVLFAIPIIAILQHIDIQGTYPIYQYFIAGAAGDGGHPRSIFAVSTDLGVICGYVTIFLLLLLANLFTKNRNLTIDFFTIFLCLLLFLYITAGVLSGSRNYLLTTGFGLFFIIILIFRKNLQLMFFIFLIMAILFLYFVTFMPIYSIVKMSNFFPLLGPLSLGLPFTDTSFTINLNLSAFGDRKEIWILAAREISDNFVFGISNGGFRLLMEEAGGSRINNAHNAYLQVLIDTGVIGSTVIIMLIYKALRRLYQKPAKILFVVSVAVSLLVDNFLDHSLPWIILTTFSVSLLSNLQIPTLRKLGNAVPINTFMFIIFFALLTSTILSYKKKNESYLSLSSSEKIERIMLLHPRIYNKSEPYFIDDHLLKNLVTNRINFFSTVTPLTTSICNYSYSKSLWITDPTRKFESYYRLIEHNTTPLFIIKTQNIDCPLTLETPLQIENWVSNNQWHLEKNKTAKGLILEGNHLMYWSPIFTAEKGGRIELSLKKTDGNESTSPITLEITTINKREYYSSKKETVTINKDSVNHSVLLSTDGLYYIKIKIKNNSFDANSADVNKITLLDAKLNYK